MDEHQFDRLTRRFVLGGFTAALGLGMERLLDPASARKGKKRKKKVKFNEFGCVNVGNFCKHDDQCCSGICEGKKGKRKCRNHDAGSGCQKGDNSCVEDLPDCTTATGISAQTRCGTTTGNASYCWFDGDCMNCSKDEECQELCGPAAACIKCPNCSMAFDTACVGPGNCPPVPAP